MFSRARRHSKVQQTRQPEPLEPLPTVSPAPYSATISTRSESPALPSPAFSSFDVARPSSSDSAHIAQRKSKLAFGPPILPPIPRIASTKEGPRRTDSAPDVPVLNVQDASSAITSGRSAPRPQRTFDHFSRPKSTLTVDSLPLRDSKMSSQKTTNLTLGGDSSRVSPSTPSSFAFDVDSTLGPSQSLVSDEKQASGISHLAFPPPSNNILDINFDSPVMEASMFPAFTPKQPLPVLPDPPLMNRSFIDSRDRPYSQPNVRSPPISTYDPRSQSPFAQHYALPTAASSSPSQKPPRTASSIGAVSTASSVQTIGLPFESTSIKHPPPKLVQTRPKTGGVISKVAGVDVPTHHTSSVKSNKSDKSRRKSLNPVSLFGRRKSTSSIAPAADVEKAQALATERQKTVAAVGVPKIPDGYDPAIKGKVVHDFSAPRRSTMSPIEANFPSGIAFDSPPSQARQSRHLSAQRLAQGRPISRSPIFVENFEERPSPIDRTSGGIGAESRENKSFLARFSQQSSTSTFSQESAILPPFARKSQILDAANNNLWREEEGSWSSGRDSGGHSSAAPGDRESGLSSFSVVSPITGRSSVNGVVLPFDSSMLALGNLSPISPNFERKLDPLDRPISTVSTTSDKAKTRSLNQGTTAQLDKDAKSPPLPAEAEDEKQRRFSFQSGINGAEDEIALEKKAMPPAQDLDDEEEFEYFDENAIDDLDELELQNQTSMPPMALQDVSGLVEEPAFPVPTQEPAVQPAAQPPVVQEPIQKYSPKVRRANSDDFFYDGHIPYQVNERELTYAEHPVFQTHSALVDSRRTSYQSTFLDSYLASSPTSSSPRRQDDGSGSERRGSTPSIIASRTGRDRSISGSSIVTTATRGGSTQATSTTIMSPLHEREEPTQSNDMEPSTPVMNGDFKAFRFSNSPIMPETTVKRADSDVEPPKWSRTANLWKQYSAEPSSRASTPSLAGSTTTHTSAPVTQRSGPRVRKPTGAVQQARNSTINQRASAISTNERVPPRSVRASQYDRLSTRSPMLAVPRAGTPSSESRPTSKLSMASVVKAPPLVPQNTVQGAAVESHHSTAGSEVRLQVYHQALADAANKAAAAGRFARKSSVATVETGAAPDGAPVVRSINTQRISKPVHASSAALPAAAFSHEQQPVADADINPERQAVKSDSLKPADKAPTINMAFDFGFEDSGFADQVWDDADIIAAANADALASDNAGFYGSEFSFYANAKPGIDQSQSTDGGFFGEDGDDGLARRRSVKEPNLTPITERSEFSTRNSFVGLGGYGTPTATTASLARMPMSALNEGDIVTFEQLKKLRQNAFGGSSVSLSSSPARGSPTSPHFASSVAASSDSTGSIDSRHHSAILEDLSHNAAMVSSHKSSPLISH